MSTAVVTAQAPVSVPKPPRAPIPAPAATQPEPAADVPAPAAPPVRRQISARASAGKPEAALGGAAEGTPAARAAEPDSEPHSVALSAEGAEDEDGAEAEEGATSLPQRARGANGLARQMSSVERQLGRARRQGGFFVSNWFTDTPSAAGFARPGVTATTAPDDCEPLDAAIAEAYIRDSSRREGVNADLVREIVRKESGFNPCALSPKGAMGMMQLTAETAASLGVDDPYDPRQNIDGGVRLMKRLLEKYKGRPDLALAAYNAGEAPVDAGQRVPDYQETQEYVSTIMKRVFEEPLKPGRSAARPPARIPSITPIPAPGLSAAENK